MASSLHPMVNVPDQQPDPVDQIDLSTLDLPDKPNPVEDSYHQTLDVHPDKTADIIKTARQLGQDPVVVAGNLETAKKAAGIPPSEYFSDLIKRNPRTADYLSEPQNMAVAKDDMDNLAKHEDLVQGYSAGRELFNSLSSKFADVNAQMAAVPQLANSLFAAVTRTPLTKFPGSEEAIKYWQDQARTYSPPINDQSISDVLKTGNPSLIAKKAIFSLVNSVPSLAMYMAANAAAPGAGTAVAGVTSAAEVNARNVGLGISPAASTINASYHGAINAAFMNLGVDSPLQKWESAIAESVGKDTARKVVVDMAKTLAGSAASFGGSMAAISLGSNAIDATTGVNPQALQGAGKRALDALIEGGITGGAVVGPSAILGGFQRSGEMQRIQQTQDFYTAMGDTAGASKLRERLPEAHRDFVEQITKDSPVENISIPAEKFDTYFQSKNIDPDDVARDLGVDAQMPGAREAGGDVSIPLATWVDKVVGTPHYEALRDDIRFHPEDLTANEVKEKAEVAGQMVQSEADKAVKENPALQAGHDFVYNELKRQIAETGQVDKKIADNDAKLGAAMITQMAAQRGMDPKEFFEKGSIKVTSGQAADGRTALKQGEIKPEGGSGEEASSQARQGQQPTGQVPLDQQGKKPASEEALSTVFPGPVDSSLRSITAHPDYFKMVRQADNVVRRYAKERGIEPTHQLAKDLFVELHNALGEIRTAKREERVAVAERILKQYPTIENDFMVLKNQLWSDHTPEYFDLFVRDKNRFQQSQFQGDPETDPRGFIEFTPKEAIINLVKADASTFPHELAHYWLKNFHEFVQTSQASEQHQADWKVLADWLKVDDAHKDLSAEQHEKFARGFETYLREGKAPSEGLRGVFAKFRRWLTRLYKDPVSLGVELNENVRGVMDRMLASEDEIAFAERSMGMDLGKEYEGLDPKVAEKLVAMREQAHEAAVTQLLGEQMAEMSTEHRAKLTNEAVSARVKAEDQIKDSDIQQSMAAVNKTFGREARDVAGEFRSGKMEGEKRAQLEQLAEARGYSSADELSYKIMQEPPIEKQVQSLVDQHMAKFADMRDNEKIREAALKIVHGEKATELMAMEQSVFQSMVDEAQGRLVDQRRRAQQARIEAEAVKAKARELIAAKPVGEASQYMPYFTAERQAALRVQKALMEKDYDAAALAKRQQMLNHALASEALKVRDEVARGLRFFDRFASRGKDLKDMPYGFLRQIDTLLADRGLAEPRNEDGQTYLAIAQDMAAKGDDADEIAHRTGWVQDVNGQWKAEQLSDTVVRIQNDYRNVAIPQSVLTTAPAPYRTMSLGDFRDLKAAVKALNAVGRGYDNFLDENIKIDRKTAAGQLRAFLEQNIGSKYAEGRDLGSKPGANRFTEKIDGILNLPNAAIPSLVNLLTICDFLDAGKPDGLMKNLVYRPLLHADSREIRMQSEAVKDMNRIHEKYWSDGEFEKFKKEKIYIASRDRDMTRDEILAVALNWGTETNRQRVTDGYHLTPDQTREILSHVDKRQWGFAQAIWDHMDSYWPQIVANQEKISGETPVKIKASPVETPDGTYPGGYYPLSYDYKRSSEALNNIEARNALYKTAGAVMAHTEHGFTESRVKNYVAPVRLDTNVIYTHLQDVMHDLSYRQSVVDVNGFLRQKDAREALINAIGLDGYRTIEQHLKWAASDQGEYLTAADRILRRLRFGATIATLGFRPMTAPIFFSSNLINAAKDVGPVNFGNAIKDFLNNRDENVQLVDGLSARMAKRSTLRDRDLMDMAKRHQGEESLLQHFAFYPHNKADQAITYPLWLMSYRANIAEYGQQKAIDLADEAVTKLAGSGSIIDQSMIQRGSESKKIFTWWYSWAGTQFNRMWKDGKLAGLEYDKGNIGTALTVVATSALYGWVLQGANENLWREWFRNSPDGVGDDDKKNKRMAERMIMQGIGYVPIFRELAQYGIGKVMGQPSDIQLPFQQAVQTVANPLADMARASLTDKTLSPRFWENTAKEAAMGAGYPQYLNTLAFNFLDYLNDQGDLSWRDLFTRRTKS